MERETGNSHVNMAASLLESALPLPQALRGCLLPWKEMSFRRQTPYGDRELREDKHTGGGGRVWVQQMKRVKTTEERKVLQGLMMVSNLLLLEFFFPLAFKT